MPIAIYSIPDPPDGSTIRVQRVEHAAVLLGFVPAEESSVNRAGFHFLKGFLGCYRGFHYALICFGLVFTILFMAIIIQDEAPIGTKFILLSTSALFSLMWFGMLFYGLKRTRPSARAAKLLTTMDELPSWRIEIRPDRLMIFLVEARHHQEVDPNSLHDLRISDDNRVVGRAYDLRLEKNAPVVFSAPLPKRDAQWLLETLM